MLERAEARPREWEPAEIGSVYDGIAGLSRFCLRVATPDAARFHVRRDGVELGALRIGVLELSPLQLLSNHRPAAPTVAILRRGTADVRVDGRIVTIGAGEAIAFTALEPRSFTSRSPSTWFAVEATTPGPWHEVLQDGRIHLVGDLSMPLLALTQSSVAAVQARTASHAELRHLERALELVLAGLFAGADPHDPSGLDAVLLRRRALTVIEDGYTDPMLRSSDVARALNVSLRTLQRAYEEASAGTTVTEEIARFRREHAVRLLEDRTLVRLPIAGVAQRSGYAKQAGLRRAFAQAFGMSPSTYRSERTRRPPAAGSEGSPR